MSCSRREAKTSVTSKHTLMTCWVVVAFFFIFFLQGDGQKRSYPFSWNILFQNSWRQCSTKSDLILCQHNWRLNALRTENPGLTKIIQNCGCHKIKDLGLFSVCLYLVTSRDLSTCLKIGSCVKCSLERVTFLKSKPRVRLSLLKVKCSLEGWCGQIVQLNLG